MDTYNSWVQMMITGVRKVLRRNWAIYMTVLIVCHTVNVSCNTQNILRKGWGFQSTEGLIAISFALLCFQWKERNCSLNRLDKCINCKWIYKLHCVVLLILCLYRTYCVLPPRFFFSFHWQLQHYHVQG